jgi:hypothetical protein
MDTAHYAEKCVFFYQSTCLYTPGGCKLIFIAVRIHYTFIEAYRHIARQRSRKKQRVQPWLCYRRINKLPFLSNSSVKTSPRKQHNTRIQLQWKKGSFLLSLLRGYIVRTPGRLRNSVAGYSPGSNDVSAGS